MTARVDSARDDQAMAEERLDAAALRQAAARLSWYHSIDLGQGVITEGQSANHLEAAVFPEVAGRSVLDVGAWDGLHSFEAERRGARRVIALDHYVWCLDWHARNAYWGACRERGELPDHRRDMEDFWSAAAMPGRAPFDFARAVLGSSVEPIVGDFMTIDLDQLGQFDVVLYLGVLYHMKEPLTALERLRSVTAGVAMIETEAVLIAGHTDVPLVRFFAGDELHGDYGNWYAASEAALHAMCRAAGFSRVETKQGPPAEPPATSGSARLGRRPRRSADALDRHEDLQHYRIVVHAYG